MSVSTTYARSRPGPRRLSAGRIWRRADGGGGVDPLAEAGELFSGSASVDFDVEVPKVSRIYNQVPVSERIGTSGALSRGAVADEVW
jgi:hypothetical protein